ncbi:MAG: MFS transporter [Rhodospirillales bacterium]|nr:MFS transporter [Rhodospirillales bacterium]
MEGAVSRLAARQRRATRVAFLVVGLATAGWAPLVPYAKLRIGLDDAGLGLVLLAPGAGALAAMPLAGLAAQHLGTRAVTLGGGLLFCAMLPLLALAPGVASLVVALAVFGAALGTVDIAMNAQAVVVERASGRPLMSGFHGMYSLGGLVGAAVASLLLYAGLAPALGAAVLAVAAGGLLLAHAGWMLPRAPAAGPGFVVPHGRLALLGALCFVSFLAEGAVLDWSAVRLRLWRGADPATAGLGYAAFSVTMAGGRLAGDALLRRWPPVLALRLGGGLAAFGFLALAALPWTAAGLAGCALIGLGAANIVPVLFGAAGRMPGMAPGPAISAAATPGYLGLLLGPALIGLAAQASTLPLALALVALLLAGVAAAARRAVG